MDTPFIIAYDSPYNCNFPIASAKPFLVQSQGVELDLRPVVRLPCSLRYVLSDYRNYKFVPP